jgi:hypothetical protein
MITITINPESFGLGFLFGTSVYVVARQASDILCSARLRIWVVYCLEN